MSMLPPKRPGGITGCDPGVSGATPIVPQNGSSGIRIPGRSSVADPDERSQMWR
jgi:hypothetical protein